jgi:hypothetical protein
MYRKEQDGAHKSGGGHATAIRDQLSRADNAWFGTGFELRDESSTSVIHLCVPSENDSLKRMRDIA